MPASSPPLPLDEALPELAELVDAERAAALLRERLATTVDSVRVRYLDVQPGHRAVVQLEAAVGDDRFDAAAVAVPGQISIARYPHDPALAHLGDPSGVADALGIADIAPVRLAWVPTQRAALRVGEVVVKHYAAPGDATTSFELMQRVHGVAATAEPLAVDGDLGVVAQRVVPGAALTRADATPAAGRALDVLARLAAVDGAGLALVEGRALLAMAEAPLALAAFALPPIADRLNRAHDRLVATMPTLAEPVCAHGDFNVGQLLDAGDELAVVDVDTLCLAERAFDVASYATNVVSGRAGDLADLDDALAALERFGAGESELAHLRWYVAATLLRRVDRAVRRLKRDWPERTERLVAVIEHTVAAI